MLDRLAADAPGLRVRLSKAGRADRLAGVRSGELDTALVRVLGSAPGLELLPVWHERLVVALPADHPAAAHPDLPLAHLGGLPLRLAERERNPAFHDLHLAVPPGPPSPALRALLDACARTHPPEG